MTEYKTPRPHLSLAARMVLPWALARLVILEACNLRCRLQVGQALR